MYRMSKKFALLRICLVMGILSTALALSMGFVNAAATTKTLSTNYTLVNLGTADAQIVASYYKDTGATWSADTASTSFSVKANGGQAIIRQYSDGTMTSGKGSAVVASTQPMGAIVQILARNGQVPTSGAYIGVSDSDLNDTYYVPLVQRKVAGGVSSSQLLIQNASASSYLTVTAQLIQAKGSPVISGKETFTKQFYIPPSTTQTYDLSDESASNLPDGWYGSAVVTGQSGGKIAVVVNTFALPDILHTYNAFPKSKVGTTWLIPLFMSRLSGSNNVSPVAVQNLSGGTFNPGDVSMSCIPDRNSAVQSTFTLTNTAAVDNNQATYFNPNTDLTIPANWYGACKVTAPGNVVSYVQMRQPNVSSNADSYLAINASGTSKKFMVPLVAKRLGNGFATAVTIQNLDLVYTATVNLTYTPSPDYVSGGGSSAVIPVNGLTIPPGGSLIRNHRLSSGGGPAEDALPDLWFGTLTVESVGTLYPNQYIDGFVQLTNIKALPGDNTMTHGVFPVP